MLPGLVSHLPACFGSITWHLCPMQVGEKAEYDELRSPEASRDHGRLPGGAGLAEWEGFSGSREGRDQGGKKAQRQKHKSCFRGKSKLLNPLLKMYPSFVIHFHCKTFSKGGGGGL